LYNENIRKIREAIPDATEDEAKEILDTIIAYEEKQESLKSMEDKSKKLYENKQEIIDQINELNQDPINNQPQIQALENRLEKIENSINKLDKKINDIY
jgi:flagellar biosynthesis chaperone FliJ